MLRRTCIGGMVFAALVFSMAVGVCAQPAPSVSVTVAGQPSLTLTAADLAKMPRASVTTTTNGIDKVYEGVWLSDVLKKAGAPLGSNLMGAALASYVLASASDGYQVLFSLGELDPGTTDGQFLLADKADGKPLFGKDGDFRLVVPKDKRGARSVRLLTKIEVVQLRK